MKNILKKLHIVPNESDDVTVSSLDGSSSSFKVGRSRSRTSSPARRSLQMLADQKPLSGFSNWLSSVTSKNAGPETSGNSDNALSSFMDREKAGDVSQSYHHRATGLEHDVPARCSEMSESCDLDMEAYQIQRALKLSAEEDPEAVQIEAVKQISLGSCRPENTPAEVISYRYWNYSVLSYDDKILDGFYDLHGIFEESSSEKMPSLTDLQKVPESNARSREAILVNRASDTELSNLENRALFLAAKSKSDNDNEDITLIRNLAVFVAENMGGAVRDPEVISKEWRDLSSHLRMSFGSIILPLGHLTTGLARHRALMFKVLADSVGVPCQLMKGHLYTGSDDGAINIVKMNNGREYIVDLMADPGTLIPSDAEVPRDDGDVATSCSSFSENETLERRSFATSENESNLLVEKYEKAPNLKSQHDKYSFQGKNLDDPFSNLKVPARKTSQGYSLLRSPSWTEGISPPNVCRMKAKDVTLYVLDAAKENPQLAQKLHDVLVDIGVVAPPNLFSEICPQHPDPMVSDDLKVSDKQKNLKKNDEANNTNSQFKLLNVCSTSHHLEPVEGLGAPRPLDSPAVSSSPEPKISLELQNSPAMMIRNMPVAAAAATAAVVASSMVVAAAKSNSDCHLEVPVAAAAATATAAVVAATTAAVSKQYEFPELFFSSSIVSPTGNGQVSGEEDGVHHSSEVLHEAERNSDRSTGNESTKSDVALDDVGEFEILWEDLTVGERIGLGTVHSLTTCALVRDVLFSYGSILVLGSYGEVFHGELHGTEVAIKKFLQQELLGDALDEFRAEVQIMKRLRHPNVVLFMGAVTRVPNLSIVTEFLPRGSLFRLIHRPNNQLDERKRIKMALDVARGMNYLHNCSPTIVHGDLKSPNLLVDKNWVVKVCDFGLSRMKHSTFLSSRSMAGTAEWMAPEVLRNEPSDEKCDVYSFGVIMWELCTLQQPWGGMNPMQVVGAVGFQCRQLDIPHDLNPDIADIIVSCWKMDPKLRPSFSEIMAALKPLQRKPLISTSVSHPKTDPHPVC